MISGDNVTAIIVEVIAVIGVVFVAVLQLRAEKERKRRKRADEERAKVSQEHRADDIEMELARGRVMMASGELAYVTSIAVTGGHTNGNVEEAQEAFKAARENYDALEARLSRKYLQHREL